MDLNLLRVFDAMLRTGNTTLAGEALGLSQSGISNALKRLRSHFLDPLFVPTADGMKPTRLALEMSEPIQSALDQIARTVEGRPAFDPATSDRNFCLYVSDVFQTRLLPSLLSMLASEAPNMTITTTAAMRRDAPFLLKEGNVDLAVGYFSPLGDAFHRQVVATESRCCVVRRDHPAVRGVLTLEQFFACRHIVYRPGDGSELCDALDKACESFGAKRKVALALAYLTSFPDIISQSDFICTVPALYAATLKSDARVKILPLPFAAPSLEISAQWHTRLRKDAELTWLRSRILSLLQDDPVVPPERRFTGQSQGNAVSLPA